MSHNLWTILESSQPYGVVSAPELCVQEEKSLTSKEIAVLPFTPLFTHIFFFLKYILPTSHKVWTILDSSQSVIAWFMPQNCVCKTSKETTVLPSPVYPYMFFFLKYIFTHVP